SYPVCGTCGEQPPSFRIRAHIENEDGKKRYFDIRHTHDGRKFEDPIDLLFTLKQIRLEMMAGEFNADKYAQYKVRKGLLFKNFVQEYLEFNEKRLLRNVITSYGMKGKVKYTKVLTGYFG